MSFTEDLMSTLGKTASSSEFKEVVNSYALSDVYDDPPFRKYVGSSQRGIDLLLENDIVLDIQFFVQRSETHAPFADALPFGLQSGMTDKEVHSLLGKPDVRDTIGSRYTIFGGSAKLNVVYDKFDVINYVDIHKI